MKEKETVENQTAVKMGCLITWLSMSLPLNVLNADYNNLTCVLLPCCLAPPTEL